MMMMIDDDDDDDDDDVSVYCCSFVHTKVSVYCVYIAEDFRS